MCSIADLAVVRSGVYIAVFFSKVLLYISYTHVPTGNPGNCSPFNYGFTSSICNIPSIKLLIYKLSHGIGKLDYCLRVWN